MTLNTFKCNYLTLLHFKGLMLQQQPHQTTLRFCITHVMRNGQYRMADKTLHDKIGSYLSFVCHRLYN